MGLKVGMRVHGGYWKFMVMEDGVPWRRGGMRGWDGCFMGCIATAEEGDWEWVYDMGVKGWAEIFCRASGF